MACSNKPLVWGLFAAGGTLAAFVLPALVLLGVLAGLGLMATGLEYEQMRLLLSGWPGKTFAFVLVSLCLWHTAHRLRTALHGLGLRADGAVALIGYGGAALGTVLTIHYLLEI